MSNTFVNWFDTFIAEKNLENIDIDWIINHNGVDHFIGSDVVFEGIRNAPKNEQMEIKNMIVKIDFKNGDVVPFFKFLAEQMIKTQFK